jgi:predicted nucleotidyltransferase
MLFMKQLKGLVEEIKKNRKVVGIILFGSHAKNRATPISDIDICIIGRKLRENEKARIEALGNEKIRIVFFDELPLPIKFRVFKEGKFLYLKDEAFVNSLRAQTISYFLDFKPILERYCRRVYGWKYEI